MTDDTINDAMTMRPGSEGTLLVNRYRIVRQLGQGGMGSVWLVEDTQLDNKQFAVKMLPSILVANKRAYRQLKDEALVAMRLVHPNIVQIRAFEENNGNPFLVMDYVDGQTLDDYLADCFSRVEHVERVEEGDGRGTCPACPSGGISEADVLRILRPVAAALDYAHGKGVVHRDVKPGNVMIAKDGTPYILDFGIAREIQETMTRMTGKLSSGTLLYMSPEQLHGASPKPAQDIYSFAAMAYECLKGDPPFVRGQIEYQIDNDSPAPLPGTTGGVSSRGSGTLAASVMAGLAKKPEDRPATCAAVLRESGAPAASAGTANGSGKSAASPNPQPPVDVRIPCDRSVGEEDAARVRVEAKMWQRRIGRLPDGNGLAEQKSALEEMFVKAEMFFESRLWGDALREFAEYARQCEVLEKLEEEQRVQKQRCETDGGHKKIQLWKGGPYWAETNIGAENPWNFGYYFWWGDTVGYKRENDAWVTSDESLSGFAFDEKSTPIWNKHPFDLLGKGWVTILSRGWFTTDYVLTPEHDAAHVQWGDGWRMPTKQELNNLCKKCDWTWTDMEGVNGYVVRGRGDYASASIFLPAAGYGNGLSLNDAGSYGGYWSSVPDSDGYDAWRLYFSSGYHDTSSYLHYRYYGQSVRPVQGFTK